MKRLSLMLALLCGAAVMGAEFPDFAKAESWQKSSWTKSTYNCADGVMSIERKEGEVPEGSGAWCSVDFPVSAGETISGTVDFHYIARSAKGSIRVGIDAMNASNKRVEFLHGFGHSALNDAFETKKFSVKIPEGAVKARIYFCLDNFGKVEFKNPKISK